MEHRNGRKREKDRIPFHCHLSCLVSIWHLGLVSPILSSEFFLTPLLFFSWLFPLVSLPWFPCSYIRSSILHLLLSLCLLPTQTPALCFVSPSYLLFSLSSNSTFLSCFLRFVPLDQLYFKNITSMITANAMNITWFANANWSMQNLYILGLECVIL